jgi:antitoxin ParD1/3/4
MSTMNVSLPATLKKFVDQQVRHGHFGTSSEYIRELIRRDEARHVVREMLLEGIASPGSTPVDARFWAERKRVLVGKRSSRRRA